MKKSIQIIATALVMLFGEPAFSQNDTMYMNYGGNVTIAIPTSQIDSLTFYRPNITPSITDADGNVYTSVTIGTQEWMSENLRTTKYSDGNTIPNLTDDDEWANDTTGAWFHYDNDHQYDTIYGKLYNWHVVETGKLCPIGWHVPTDAEWTVLNNYLAADGHEFAQGKALKSTSGWYEDGSGTDDYGWNGLPGGFRSTNYFSFIGLTGYWWSSLEHDTSRAWFYDITSYFSGLNSSFISKNTGFSVRCIRDVEGTQTNSQVRLENEETPLDIYQSGVPIDSIIGKTYQGGIIAYLDTLDGTGLIAAPHDQSRLRWGCGETSILGADGIAIGTGKQNTADIIAGCSSTNIASYYCDTLTIGGYNDWFLPSKDELNKLYQNIGQGNTSGMGNIGGFSSFHYWSSSEYNYYSAWSQYFYFGSQNNNKSKSSYNFSSVRAVRYF